MKIFPHFLEPYIPVSHAEVDELLGPGRRVDVKSLDEMIAAIEEERGLEKGKLARYQRFWIRLILG